MRKGGQYVIDENGKMLSRSEYEQAKKPKTKVSKPSKTKEVKDNE